jgi:hypothetical protein
MTNNKTIRTIGGILTVVLTALGSYWVAFNVPIESIPEQLFGLWPIGLIVLIVASIVLLIKWPESWNDTLRWVLVGVLVVIALVFGGDLFRDYLLSVPLTMVGFILVSVPILWVLYSLTIKGGFSRKASKTVKTTTPETTTETTTKKTTPIPSPASAGD